MKYVKMMDVNLFPQIVFLKEKRMENALAEMPGVDLFVMKLKNVCQIQMALHLVLMHVLSYHL